MATPPWYKGVVIKIENENYNTKKFWIQIPEVTYFSFVPGQFVTLDLPIHDRPNKRWRSYSIASWPEGNVIELVIVILEGGAGTNYLFKNVEVGSELQVRGPQGVFVLPPFIDKTLIFICTGTGIAPFRSMLHYIKNNQVPHQPIHLIFGTRSQRDLLYYQEIRELEEAIPHFTFTPTLSREAWEGCCGYVHGVYEELCKDKPAAKFYLCGWKAMVDEAKKRILLLGYEKKDIHLELYG